MAGRTPTANPDLQIQPAFSGPRPRIPRNQLPHLCRRYDTPAAPTIAPAEWLSLKAIAASYSTISRAATEPSCFNSKTLYLATTRCSLRVCVMGVAPTSIQIDRPAAQALLARPTRSTQACRCLCPAVKAKQIHLRFAVKSVALYRDHRPEIMATALPIRLRTT